MEKGGVPFWNSALSSILHKALRSHGVRTAKWVRRDKALSRLHVTPLRTVHASGQLELGRSGGAYHSRAREKPRRCWERRKPLPTCASGADLRASSPARRV